MGILCLDAGEKCSNNFASEYQKIQKTVMSFMTKQKVQGLIDFGKLLGD